MQPAGVPEPSLATLALCRSFPGLIAKDWVSDEINGGVNPILCLLCSRC